MGGGPVASVVGSVGPGLAVGVVFLVYFLAIVGSLVMMVVALVDIVRRPEWQWKLAGQEKVLWLLLVILLNVLAIPALIYWFNIRKRLTAVERSANGRPLRTGSHDLFGMGPVGGPVCRHSTGRLAPGPRWSVPIPLVGRNRWTDRTWSAQPADPRQPSPPR